MGDWPIAVATQPEPELLLWLLEQCDLSLTHTWAQVYVCIFYMFVLSGREVHCNGSVPHPTSKESYERSIDSERNSELEQLNTECTFIYTK
jgi:hypothetical protein